MQEASTEISRAVVANFFRALRAGDMNAVRAAFAPDATWICAAAFRLRGCGPARTESWMGSSPRYSAASTRRCPWYRTFTGSSLTASMPSPSGHSRPDARRPLLRQ